ncbi:hypothetical protein [uncultured Bacteroides sp.]|nr:hypothetical protein [uncultured Bacteroides sp.]
MRIEIIQPTPLNIGFSIAQRSNPTTAVIAIPATLAAFFNAV